MEGRNDLLIQALQSFEITRPRGEHDFVDTRIDEFANAINDIFSVPSNRARTYLPDELIHFSLIV